MKLIALQLLLAIASGSGVVSFPQQPAGPDAPEIEVVSAKWTRRAGKTAISTDTGISSETIQRSGEEHDPMPVIVPNPKVSAKPTEYAIYTYSTTIINRGQKDIKALAWDYVFRDSVTQEDLRRQMGFSATGVGRNQKSTMEFKSYSSPPKVINANVSDSSKPYDELVIIQCVLFRDGAMGMRPKANAKVCETLRYVRPGRSGALIK